MQIFFDDAKRDKTLAERGLDFANAAAVFAGVHSPAKSVARTTAKSVSSLPACFMSAWWLWSGPCAAQIAASFP
jgi:hypothetical protein